MERIPASERTREKLKAVIEKLDVPLPQLANAPNLIAADYRGSAGGRGARRAGARVLRPRCRARSQADHPGRVSAILCK